jgi:hypothetical protein
MGTTLNRDGYQKLIDEDIEWLEKMPRTLSRDHAIAVLKYSVFLLYGPKPVPLDKEARDNE